MKTIQINIRISDSLASEIDSVADLLRINRMEWIRLTLAREVIEEHKHLLNEARELQALMDSDLGKVVQQMRKRARES